MFKFGEERRRKPLFSMPLDFILFYFHVDFIVIITNGNDKNTFCLKINVKGVGITALHYCDKFTSFQN